MKTRSELSGISGTLTEKPRDPVTQAVIDICKLYGHAPEGGKWALEEVIVDLFKKAKSQELCK